MVEHATENRGVPSSNLGLGTTLPARVLLLLPALLAALALVVACGDDDDGFDVTGTLAPGEVLTAPGTDVRATFVGVTGDSRCPVNVTCIRAGDATVRIDLDTGDATHEISLVVPRASPAQDTVAGITLVALDLQPLPVAPDPVPAADYRLSLRLTRP